MRNVCYILLLFFSLIALATLAILLNIEKLVLMKLSSLVSADHQLVKELEKEVKEECKYLSNKAFCYWLSGGDLVLKAINYTHVEEVESDSQQGDCKTIAITFASLMKRLNVTDKLYLVYQSPYDNKLERLIRVPMEKSGHVCVIGIFNDRIYSFNCFDSLEINEVLKI